MAGSRSSLEISSTQLLSADALLTQSTQSLAAQNPMNFSFQHLFTDVTRQNELYAIFYECHQCEVKSEAKTGVLYSFDVAFIEWSADARGLTVPCNRRVTNCKPRPVSHRLTFICQKFFRCGCAKVTHDIKSQPIWSSI